MPPWNKGGEKTDNKTKKTENNNNKKNHYKTLEEKEMPLVGE